MTASEIRGRFLPSRTYARWRWTLRCGLLIVPLLVFVLGTVELYLTPNKYRSVCVFSVNHGPTPDELVALARSKSVIAHAVGQLGLAKAMDLDLESTAQAVMKNLHAKVISGTRLIELAIVFNRKEAARDLAEQVPKSLIQHLADASRQGIEAGNREFNRLIEQSSDEAEQKSAELANLQKIHGIQPPETVQQTMERAKRASILADAEVERLRSLRVEAQVNQLKILPNLEMHSVPVIGDHPFSPDVGPELGSLVVKSLVFGLISALALPYLFEFAFPPSHAAPKLNPVIDL